MKPKWDLDDPRVKIAIEIYQRQISEALAVEQSVESAVLPIFWTYRNRTKPEQVGSGVVVRIQDEVFVFSASHVFDDIGEYALLIGLGGGEPLSVLSGERFSTGKGASGSHLDDPIDASVFHVQGGLSEKLKALALSVDDLDLGQPDDSGAVFLASGFRVRKSRTLGDQANGRRECFPSREHYDDEYSDLELNREIHLALAYEKQALVGGKWQTSPLIRGFSGGAIIKVEGIFLRSPFQDSSQKRQLLSAITIAQRTEKGRKPGAIIGTRVNVHLSLIEHFLPGLVNMGD